MLKYITRFFAFLLPIVRKVGFQVAADTLTRMADGKGNAVRRPDRQGNDMWDYAKKDVAITRTLFTKSNPPFTLDNAGFHDVLMVAFDVMGPNARATHQWLMDNMPKPGTGGDMDEIYLEAWWVANDERFDRSDCDSAVFVNKGDQDAARALLRAHGLAANNY